MNKVLVSTCLLGYPIRYNGTEKHCDNKRILSQWQNENRLVHFCPELAVNFPTPRPPAEIVSGDGKTVLNGQAKVIEKTGNEVTKQFVRGAQETLKFAKDKKVKLAILTDGSPSCGCTFIYDGNFTGKTVAGKGVTAELLEKNGIRVFSQNHIEDALEYINNLDCDTAKIIK